ncbi:outer membrane lipopolysaccharide assembly protein LptE/RlpB [Pseudomonas sp. TE3786]
MKLKILAVIAVYAVLAGCAWQTPAMKLDNQLYQTSATASLARGAQTGARRLALEEANAKCTSLGSEISVLDIQSHWAFPTNGVAFVTFACNPMAERQAG